MSDTNTPKSFGKWLENLWYHEKFKIIIGALALVIVVTCSIQFFTRKKQDAMLYHIAMSGLTAASSDDLRASMKLIADDYNGDGAVVVDFKEEIYVPNEPVALGQPTTIDRFNLELASGECLVYVMDQSFYLGNRDFMCDLADVMETVPDYAYDEKAFRLGDIPAYGLLKGIHDLDDDSYVCLRLKRDNMSEREYENGVKFFNAFVLYGADEE